MSVMTVIMHIGRDNVALSSATRGRRSPVQTPARGGVTLLLSRRWDALSQRVRGRIGNPVHQSLLANRRFHPFPPGRMSYRLVVRSAADPGGATSRVPGSPPKS